jgi:release factor glutamine methyltransferase
MTVLEVIQRSTQFLAKKGVDAPRLQTELLLAHLLGLPRMQLYLNFERTITAADLDTFRACIKRRGQREPIQYIVGTTSFCGLEIRLSREVLIPRPETELLAEQGWIFLNQLSQQIRSPCLKEAAGHQFCQNEKRESRVLDFGTGSGCLAVTLAVKCPETRVFATDISAGALALAGENAARHNVGDRITFFQGDGFAPLPTELRVDLIVANPPYVPSGELPTLQPEVRDYEPCCALDGGADGLDYYRRLSFEAPAFLTSRGKIMLELGDGQAEAVRRLFEKQNWIVEDLLPDYTQRPRIAIAHRPG